MNHIVTKKTLRTHRITIIAVFAFIIAGFVLIGNIFLFVIHDARERIIDTAIQTVSNTLGAIAQDTTVSETVLNTVLDQLAEDTEGLIAAHVVRGSGTSTIVVASLHDTDATTAVYEPQTVLTSQTLPEQTIQTVGGDGLIYSAYTFVDQAGVPVGYIEAVFQPQLFATPVHRNIIRTGVIVLLMLAATIFVLFWFIGIGGHQRLLRKTARIAQVHDEVVSRIVHEIQTPLTVMSGYIAMLQAGAATLEPTTQQYIKRIKHTTHQLERFIQNVSYAVELEQKTTSDTLTTHNPVVLVQQAIDAVEYEHTSAVPITFTTTSTAPVYVNATYFSLALEHVLINAIQHTTSGSICVSIVTEGGDVCISVEDTGAGMSPHEILHATDKWYRGRLPQDTLHRGSGLGLWIAERCIARMHGKMILESAFGVGTKVTIRLPRVQL